MKNKELSLPVKDFMRAGGIDLLGVLPIEEVAEAEPGYGPQDLMPKANSVSVFAIRLFEFPRLEKLDEEGKPIGMTKYTANFFIAADILDHLAYRTSRLMHEA